MSSVDEIVAFLRAAHDEIVRVAGAASFDGTWTDAGDWDTARVEDAQRRRLARVHSEADARHIALHDPRAAIARVQAERQVVNEYEVWDAMRNERTAVAADLLSGVVRMMAYGHRHTVPGYDPAWAPEGADVPA